MDLDGDNVVVPFGADVFPYCWKQIFLLVDIDSNNDETEVNEDNNLGVLPIALDCGDEVITFK